MKSIFTKYRLQMIKEESHKYEISKKISSPKDATEVVKCVLGLHEQAEEVGVLITLNNKNNVTGLFEVSRGTINASYLNCREIFKRAILNNAKSIIVAHNHPSGDSTPSKEDISVTEAIKKSGHFLGIELLDHIIIGDDNSTSLKERGLI